MSESKHAPWVAIMGFSDWGIPCAHLIVEEGDDGSNYDTWIAEIPSITPYPIGARPSQRIRATEQANRARIIAAAPDMLAALYAVVEVADRYMHFDPDSRFGEAIQDARAAISKAKGESK